MYWELQEGTVLLLRTEDNKAVATMMRAPDVGDVWLLLVRDRCGGAEKKHGLPAELTMVEAKDAAAQCARRMGWRD